MKSATEHEFPTALARPVFPKQMSPDQSSKVPGVDKLCGLTAPHPVPAQLQMTGVATMTPSQRIRCLLEGCFVSSQWAMQVGCRSLLLPQASLLLNRPNSQYISLKSSATSVSQIVTNVLPFRGIQPWIGWRAAAVGHLEYRIQHPTWVYWKGLENSETP